MIGPVIMSINSIRLVLDLSYIVVSPWNCQLYDLKDNLFEPICVILQIFVSRVININKINYYG
jgi:hypothetical protein